jgi:hypothetical protein
MPFTQTKRVKHLGTQININLTVYHDEVGTMSSTPDDVRTRCQHLAASLSCALLELVDKNACPKESESGNV